jgi:hypothetical protein
MSKHDKYVVHNSSKLVVVMMKIFYSGISIGNLFRNLHKKFPNAISSEILNGNKSHNPVTKTNRRCFTTDTIDDEEIT